MSEIREKIINAAVSRTEGRQYFSQIGSVLYYHDDNERCFCEKHRGEKIPHQFRGTVDIFIVNGKHQRKYEHIGCTVFPPNLIGRSLKAGDRVLVQYINGDIGIPIVCGILKSPKRNETYRNKLRHQVPAAFRSIE